MDNKEFEQTRKNPAELNYKQDFARKSKRFSLVSTGVADFAENKIPDTRHTLFTTEKFRTMTVLLVIALLLLIPMNSYSTRQDIYNPADLYMQDFASPSGVVDFAVPKESNCTSLFNYPGHASYAHANLCRKEETGAGKKKITIRSLAPVHIYNSPTYATLPELPFKPEIYHIINSARMKITNNPAYNVRYLDTNSNGLYDRIEWTIPMLSEQIFEIDLNILNVQSYPAVGRNWTVMFNTTGTADLRISASNRTTWSNTNETEDLKFSEVRCGEYSLNYTWTNNSVFIENYTCNETGYEISKVLTPGWDGMKFVFGTDIKYVHNAVSEDIIFVHQTPENNSRTANNWIYINITSNEDLNQSILQWGNSTGYCNISMQNASKINWYANITDLSNCVYNYTVWIQDTAGAWAQTKEKFVTVNATAPPLTLTYQPTLNATVMAGKKDA
ncbi:MAG: hypothetical protein DRN66_03170, partial [Candidatus Nanohalarchaeota archaeon]